MKVELLQGERIDDLQTKGKKIIQNPKYFCFGMDAVLIANFAKVRNKDNVIDIGTGNGIIALLLAAKRNPNSIKAIEIQEHMADMARRNVILNDFENVIKVDNIDLKNAAKFYGKDIFDVVVTNPPYFDKGSGRQNIEDAKIIARHEVKCSLEDIIKTSFDILKHRGKFFMVHRPDRIVDIICLMRKYNIEPKYIRFVHPKVDKQPSMVLIEGSKCGGREVKILEPLYVYDENGDYTKEIMDIYADEEI